MITGFNTDVNHEGNVYHVQTEDRGMDSAVFESLVYVGGTVVAKKLTPYAEQLNKGATEEMIASLLKRQHQVIIAAIKAGRIQDLIRHSAKEPARKVESKRKTPPAASPPPKPPPAASSEKVSPGRLPASQQKSASRSESTKTEKRAVVKSEPPPAEKPPAPASTTASGNAKTGGLNLDQVISDYLKRSSEQGRLELKVLTPDVFVAGRSIGLRVQVSHEAKLEPDAIVTVKVIGTAFKPQVYIGRAGKDGIASFSIGLPPFSAGTAAIVIEANSNRGRGELKHLIRKA
jgi:hypothetical protein